LIRGKQITVVFVTLEVVMIRVNCFNYKWLWL